MKKYFQSAAIEKRERRHAEMQRRANLIIESIVDKALAAQKKTYIYIIVICIVVAFILGALTRYIQF